MGVVYKARHVKLNRLVAVKMILGGAQASARSEAASTSRPRLSPACSIRNIVQIYEVGEQDGGVPFSRLEFVDGGSLSRKLSASDRLPAVEAARMLEIAGPGRPSRPSSAASCTAT